MKERPILFSGPMIRSIRRDAKTNTRRVIQYPRHTGAFVLMEMNDGTYWPFVSMDGESTDDGHGCETPMNCPYGQTGDRIWVKETHIRRGDRAIYRADHDPVEAAGLGGMYGGWTPSIFMFRKHSRITLEITNVRVQRLQEISDEDARAEGIEPNWCGDLSGWNEQEHGWFDYLAGEDDPPCYSPRESFRSLWNSINFKRGFGWDTNPWVWALSFKQVTEVANG